MVFPPCPLEGARGSDHNGRPGRSRPCLPPGISGGREGGGKEGERREEGVKGGMRGVEKRMPQKGLEEVSCLC